MAFKSARQRKFVHYLYHYRNSSDYVPRKDPHNKTGQNPEIIIDLSLSQVKKLYNERKPMLKEGDVLQMRKTNNKLLGF